MEELPAADMGGEEEMSVEMDAEMPDAEMEEEEPMMEDMVNEVARRVARRLNEMKKVQVRFYYDILIEVLDARSLLVFLGWLRLSNGRQSHHIL